MSLPVPDKHGHFGIYGGMFVPETLMQALTDLTAEYERAKGARRVSGGAGRSAARLLQAPDAAILPSAGRRNWAARAST
ncbi:MAG: hypothetical protein R3F11_28395 [Verrucomicrobiales bacterium]